MTRISAVRFVSVPISAESWPEGLNTIRPYYQCRLPLYRQRTPPSEHPLTHTILEGNTTRIRAHEPSERTTEETTESTTDETEQICPECGGRLVTDAEHGETVCADCGLVVEEDGIDRGPEWRAFDSAEKDKKSRVGAPDHEHDARQGPLHQHRLAEQGRLRQLP